MSNACKCRSPQGKINEKQDTIKEINRRTSSPAAIVVIVVVVVAAPAAVVVIVVVVVVATVPSIVVVRVPDTIPPPGQPTACNKTLTG